MNKWMNWLLMVALHALAALPAATILVGMVRMESYLYAVYIELGVLLLFAAVLGLVLPKRVHVAWHLAILTAAAIAGAVLLRLPPAGGIALAMAGTALAVLTDRAATQPVRMMLGGYKVFAGIGLYVLAYLLEFFNRIANQPWNLDLSSLLTGPCLALLLLSVVVLNSNLMQTMCASRTDGRVPGAVRGGNWVMSAIMMGLVVVLALLQPLQKWLGGLVRTAGRWVAGLLKTGGGDLAEEGLPVSTAPPVDIGGPAREVSWLIRLLDHLIEIALNLALIALGLLVAWQIFKFLRVRVRQFLKHMNAWQNERQDYVDEQETLDEDERQAKDERRSGRMRRSGRLRRRPSLSALPDDRARVRALYRWVAELLTRQRRYDTSWTPQELVRETLPHSPEGAAFADGYNRARFSHQPVGEEDVTAALRVSDEVASLAKGGRK